MLITCPRCQFTAHLSDARLSTTEFPVCPRCKTTIPFLPPEMAPVPVEAPPQPEERRLPWETRSSALDLGALWRTTRAILFRPTAAFSSVSYEAGKRSCLLYALIYGSLGQILGIYWLTVAGILGNTTEAGTLENTIWFAGAALLTPLVLVISLYIAAGLAHLFLRVLRGARRPFSATFQVSAYVTGATSLLNLFPLNLIPVVGSMIIPVWALVLNSVGLARAHQTSTIKALFALLLPLIILVGVVLLIFVAVATIGLIGVFQTLIQPR
jgi:Yip1 domain